jgi:L-fucose isomerase-like protein
VIALARPTFDVPYAEEVARDAFAVIAEVAPGFIGSTDLLFDAPSTAAAIDAIRGEELDALVILQVTFTDSSMTKSLAEAIDVPLIFWSFPEERTGGRLRLNSLCGINLAAYALRRQGHDFGYMLRRADDPAAADELRRLIAGERPTYGQATQVGSGVMAPAAIEAAAATAAAMQELTAGVIGPHPDGFDPCAYDPAVVKELTGVTVQRIELDDLFAAANAAPSAAVEAARSEATAALGSLGELEQPALDKSLRLYCGMSSLAAENNWSGFATRCWPECFTEFGGAACAPQAMLTNQGIPGGCEADVYGTLTSLALRELAGEPPFVADLVDVDVADDSAVFWHCGVAPIHMADPEAVAGPTIHSNRRKPLLNEFPLKPGRVTIARLSQSGGSHRLVIGTGQMLRAPLPFSGTAGVVRFDRPAGDVLATIMTEGLEHHYGLVYGSFEEELVALADRWNIPVVALT